MSSNSDPLSEIIDFGRYLLSKTGSGGPTVAEVIARELEVRVISPQFFILISHIHDRFDKVTNIIENSERFKDGQKIALLNIINQNRAAFSVNYIERDFHQIITQFFKEQDLAFLDLASNSIRLDHPINTPNESEIKEILHSLDEAIKSLKDIDDPFVNHLLETVLTIRVMIKHHILYGFSASFKSLIASIAALKLAENNVKTNSTKDKLKKVGIALSIVFGALTTVHAGIEMIEDYSAWIQKGQEQLQPYLEKKMLPPPSRTEPPNSDNTHARDV